jgi:hypothetical protein
VYDLNAGLARSLELTDCRGGEGFFRHSFEPGQLVLADRGYGHERGVCSLLSQGASLLVRCEFYSNRFTSPEGRRITVDEAEALIPLRGPAEFEVRMPSSDASLRVIGERRPDGKVVWLLTNLDSQTLPKEEARSLYSQRWQVELFFKRLKSLFDLDELPTRAGPTARPWILAKLILATLAVLATDERFSPWGKPEEQEPVEAVRFGSLVNPQSSPHLF